MSTEQLPDLEKDETKKLNLNVNRSRRSFAKISSVAPVIMTLASRPSLATTCFTPSRSLSKNTSLTQHGAVGDCTGASPSTWASGSGWPSGAKTTDAFHPLFTQGTVTGTYFTKPGTVLGTTVSLSLLDVLKSTSNNLVASHIIAAYLNCLAGKVPATVLTVSSTPHTSGQVPAVQDIWHSYALSQTYNPTAGVTWDATAIVTYLTSFNIG